MKRFFCPKCQRVVRARSLPRDAQLQPESQGGMMVGTCKHHPRDGERSFLKRIGAAGRW